ncbi:flagellin domain-containing protein [Caballeronia sp. RCC_10]|uniref:flagellin domain-containing protein n=1 Tax=Caballeronia sp. RCC_10 TaxID=3239227 RepID=UPI0035252D9E
MLNINTNILSMATQKNLSGSQSVLSSAINRLSSGKRINSAADDAAGLAISTSMKSYTNALNQSVSNANNAVSMLQTASSGLSSITDNLQRIRQLAVQASDGSLSTNDRAKIDAEVQQRIGEITRVGTDTTFNGVKVLDGTAGAAVDFQVGATAGQKLTLDLSNDYSTVLTAGTDTVAGANATAAQALMTKVDTTLDSINTQQATFGAQLNRFQSAISDLQSQSTNLSAASAQITDADFAQETANLSKGQVLQQAGISVLAQANSMPQQVLKLLG